MADRTYVVGVPLAITVHENGAVSFDVDLSEVTDFTDHVEDWTPEVDQDILTVEAAAARLGNHHALPVVPPTA